MDVMAKVTISLTPAGQIQVEVTAVPDKIALLGLIELGKAAILNSDNGQGQGAEGGPKPPPPQILIAKRSLPPKFPPNLGHPG